MAELKIEHGQHWRSKATGREIVVVGWDSYWDDVKYRNVATNRVGSIYAVNLRTNYEQIEKDPPICVECGNDHACEGYTLCSDCLERTS